MTAFKIDSVKIIIWMFESRTNLYTPDYCYTSLNTVYNTYFNKRKTREERAESQSSE